MQETTIFFFFPETGPRQKRNNRIQLKCSVHKLDIIIFCGCFVDILSTICRGFCCVHTNSVYVKMQDWKLKLRRIYFPSLCPRSMTLLQSGKHEDRQICAPNLVPNFVPTLAANRRAKFGSVKTAASQSSGRI